jgi:hypothetical protein
MISAIDWAAFATLAFGCVACAAIGFVILFALSMSRLGRDLGRDAEHGFRLPESRKDKQAKREAAK